MAEKKRSAGLWRRILIVFLAIIAVIAVIADVLAFSVFSLSLDKAFPGKVDASSSAVTEARRNALNVAQTEENEGVVLLKNDGVLPTDIGKVNLLGYGAYNPVYGGSGSGGSSYTANRTDFVTAFEQAGIKVNPDIKSVYANNDSGKNTFEVDFSIPEAGLSSYTGNASFERMRDYSDTAVVVISRKGGEGNDLPTDMSQYSKTDNDKKRHYLELSEAEEALMNKTKETFKRVIVLINAGNAMELGFLDDADGTNAKPDSTGDIDAALWIGDPGDVGTKSVVNILKGEINPSGRLADIYPYAVETTPSYYNFGEYRYTNSNDCFKDFDSHPAYLVNYQEGVYIGYRYYETRTSYDYTTREGEKRTGLTYDDVVQFPFGYGLSYTTFDWKVTDVTEQGTIDQHSKISVTIDVTNTGKVAGKDVVELYYGAPYHKDGSHIQKPGAVLGGFAKTEEIQPGETKSVSIDIEASDMASYDSLKYYSSTGSYVMEQGDYTISLRHDSHTAAKNATFTYHVPTAIVFNDAKASTGKDPSAKYVGKRDSDKQTAENHFDDAAGDVTYMSRDDWAIVPGSDAEATDEQLAAFKSALTVGTDYIDDSDKAPTFGAKNGVKLADMSGKSYDDEDWDKLLDELTLDDMNTFLSKNGWGAPAIKSIGKPQTYDMDGPAALSYVFDAFMGTTTYKTLSYPAEVVLAATWNTDVAKDFAESIAKEARAWHISGWYAPGANIHRNAFAGRNFEYYSEDPLLSGAMAATVTSNVTKNGIYAYLKHFALNEQETQRHYGLCTWASEQAMREIYFKPFEMSVKQGSATAIMSSYNNIGTTWAGASSALLTATLRNEWGFAGTVLTDNLELHGFMNTQKALLAGGTSTLSNGMGGISDCTDLMKTASGQKIMREAAHQYLYTVANSYIVGEPDLTPVWRMPAIIGSVAVYVLCTAGIFALVVTGRRKRTTVSVK
ncbi:glycoside hydrolase family 3 N-terminal domain-containing protein [Bifidobacterium moukalabense]|uniref:Beta-glucosidase n=1 Tax=Bifidobacterium moukalabense DSM 27321 TaxID=1435051 RepID=W4N6Y0_9BIFI|nr:glycoside hydrolase family 3 N-terminal domain-containing protein [Bifidobacterium moukalabense]ETY70410.1 beta-glucosidase [Bifidobacterium moukalabense DSM 27321]